MIKKKLNCFFLNIHNALKLMEYITYLVELPGKELDSHDGEDEPEDDTDEQHVANGRDGLDQCVHNNLKT